MLPQVVHQRIFFLFCAVILDETDWIVFRELFLVYKNK